MKRVVFRTLTVSGVVSLLVAVFAIRRSTLVGAQSTIKDPVVQNAAQKLQQGQQIFRFDTFGTKRSGASR